ncbi:glycoside hydrolase domain-containing protein [Paenibacillus sepulcri]
MGKGVDTTVNCHSLAAAIKEAGYDFVCRYYNRNNPGKNVTRKEAEALSGAGLHLVAVWENGFPTSPGYFSYAAGKRDGCDAHRYARSIGQPANTPIYFTVDFDASQEELSGGVSRYMQGVIDAFREEAAAGTLYDIGIYGSGLTCRHMRDAFSGGIAYAWLAESRGWSGYASFSDWNIKQLAGAMVAGIPVDTNISSGRGGGFQVQGE